MFEVNVHSVLSTDLKNGIQAMPKYQVSAVILAAFLAAIHNSAIFAMDDKAPVLWLWTDGETSNDVQHVFQTSLILETSPESAHVKIMLDHCQGDLYINQQLVESLGAFAPDTQLDIRRYLRPGSNMLTMICQEAPGPSAVALAFTWVDANGIHRLSTDEDWETGSIAKGKMPRSSDLDGFAPKQFGPVSSTRLGSADRGINIDHLDDYTQWKDALTSEQGTDPTGLDLPAGFQASRLRSALKQEGSWVSMTQDPEERWIIAREKRGLLRLTLPNAGTDDIKVEVINDTLAECRGLLYAYDSLYAMANNDKALFRLRDTNGDDQFDEVTKLKQFEGDVGHGRNQLTLGPDGNIYAIFGDAVYEPENANSRVPLYARPTTAEKTRSGYVARCNADGQNWEVVVRGLRNPYGIDFNLYGDMFTYDADAEYDVGASWYRPTRVNHLIQGGDYGWRRVTGQWPPYFPDRPDMPPSTLDIGKGSPTAVEFGNSIHFPWPYSQALFVLDWTYGRILAVHLEARGSSYVGTGETFVRGRPLNVTDVEFGKDGAMYFVTGGRGTQSALYRITYTGNLIDSPSPTVQQVRRQQFASDSRDLLKQLQAAAFFAPTKKLELVHTHLGHSDPWIRHAARLVLESCPMDQWREKALSTPERRNLLAALTAVFHQGTTTDLSLIAERLLKMKIDTAAASEQIEWLFLAQQCLSSKVITAETRQALLTEVSEGYPQHDDRLNLWRSRLLADHGPPPDFVEKTMGLLEAATINEESMHYLFVLRQATGEWSARNREAYFSRLAEAKRWSFGEGMPNFLRLIEEAALAQVPENMRESYAAQLQATENATTRFLPDPSAHRNFVKKWTMQDFDDQFGQVSQGAPERGRSVFHEAKCQACHRFSGLGGVVGPDLSALSRRFTSRDMLNSILNPSEVISTKYQNETFELSDGQSISGRVLSGDYRSERLRVIPNLLEPERTIEFLKADVEHREPTPLSPMPTGLLDTFSKDEILDLLAYLQQGGKF